mmetsp:Transcript_23612/g.20533  ORF Transcript_23612/g.20533 Transcript_23612/m.20533 type:complete len:103 (-) Transcript_23612:394-702(-)
MINECFGSFELGEFDSLSDFTESFIKEYRDKFVEIYDNYREYAKGPRKFELFSDFMPRFLFDFFERIFSTLTRLQDKEINGLRIINEELHAKVDDIKKQKDD